MLPLLTAAAAYSCRGRLPLMQQQPKPKNAASFFEGLVQVAEKAAEAAEDAADTWINSGWQVKKRAGQVLPEIRPNARSISDQTTAYLSPPTDAGSNADVAVDAGGLVGTGPPDSSALVSPSDDVLQVPAFEATQSRTSTTCHATPSHPLTQTIPAPHLPRPGSTCHRPTF